jgi:tRNA (guanine37-N1)-methyltransferase
VEDKLRVSEIDGHAFIKTAPELAWTKPFAPYAPKVTTREKDKAARKERERRKAEGLPPLPATPTVANTEPAQPLTPRLPEHYIMNLPDSALTFLSSFPSSFTPLLSNESFNTAYPSREDVPMPLIHCYCFTREMEYETAEKDVLQVSLSRTNKIALMIQRASESLGHQLTSNVAGFNLHLVRSVAPHKEMYCLTFRLPTEVAFKPL